jgi:hypothetical protein
MKLIENASQWYKMYSQRAALAVMGLSSSLLAMPVELQTRPIALLGETTVQDLVIWCVLVSGFLGFVGRLLIQDKVEKSE